MNAVRLERVLSSENVDAQINTYLACIEGIGASISELRGLRLLEALKRTAIKAGPYPHATLFEAANRIMTDLVLLYGVWWLLQSRVFPFSTYVVEYGHEDKNGFDITAEQDSQKLIGEAFNVEPSFFQGKKASMLRKLRTKGEGATYSTPHIQP
jgi:hypothetical protein